MNQTREIAVSIVEDKRDIREGLQLILDNAEGFICRSVFSDAEAALDNLSSRSTDVVLMDIELPGMNGIECVRHLKEREPEIDVLILTVKDDEHSIFESLKAGAYGYMTKNVFPSKLLAAIRELCNGGAPMSSNIARQVISSFSHFQKPAYNLTDREKEVLQLLCEGKSYRVIAEELFVSPNTIRFHLKNIYKKLQVNSKYEAVIKASRDHIV